VVKAGDGEVGAEPLSERYSGALALRHRQGLPVAVVDGTGSIKYSVEGFRR
jgi:hypothetical protein